MPRVPQNFSEFFFVHYLGTGEPFSMSGRAQKPIGPKKVLRCISLGPAFIFLAINQTHLRLAFCCSTKLFSYPTEAIFWIIWNVIKHCQTNVGGGLGHSQGEQRRFEEQGPRGRRERKTFHYCEKVQSSLHFTGLGRGPKFYNFFGGDLPLVATNFN